MHSPLPSSRILAFAALLLCSLPCPSAFAGQTAANGKITDADDTDLALARRVVAILSDGKTGKCVSCHATGYGKIVKWGARFQQLNYDCLRDDATLTARQRVACLRDRAGDEESGFSPENLGLLAAGTNSAWMRGLFAEAFPDQADFQRHYGDFTNLGSMPLAGSAAPSLTEQEFSDMRHWVVDRSMARLEEVMATEPGEPCALNVTDDLRAAVAQSRQDGWRQRHLENGLRMFGCEAGQDARHCLQAFEDITAGTGFPNVAQTIRKLYETGDRSHYWVRSSPDGRYFAKGYSQNVGGFVSKLVDLTPRKGQAQQEFSIKALADPDFMADNSGFSYAQTELYGVGVCKMTLLSRLAPLPMPTVTFKEPECKRVGLGAYQSFGVSLTGGSYTFTWGSYSSDAGDGPDEISTIYNASANFTILKYNGVDYEPKGNSILVMPFEGDPIIAPSGGKLVTRFGDNGKMKGYRIRLLSTEAERGSAVVHASLAGEICGVGGKATFSMDERFIAYHRYYDVNDPSSTHMQPGSSNIFVVDLLTGATTQVTDMPADTLALFPHFRADGWMYFLVKDRRHYKEYLAASNAALLLE